MIHLRQRLIMCVRMRVPADTYECTPVTSFFRKDFQNANYRRASWSLQFAI